MMYAMDSEYRMLDDAIKSVMRRSAGDAVLLGYLLRRMMDEKLWARQYDSLDGYLREELHMDYTMACRFEAINRKYSIGGHSKDIDEKYEGFSQGVLIEMLNMPPELEAKVTPDMTVRQVREAKRQARQEKQKGKAEEEPAADDATPPTCSMPAEPVGEEAAAPPELVEPNEKAVRYLDAFAEHFVSSNIDWIQKDSGSRAEDVGLIPGEVKMRLAKDSRDLEFRTEDGTARINLSDRYVHMWDGEGNYMGDFDWYHLAAAIRRKYCAVADKMDQEGPKGFPAKDEVPDAEYRELEPAAEEVATSQLPELVKPDMKQSQYLDDFAKSFIASRHDWMLADYRNRVLDVTKSPEEMKRHLGEDGRTWYFPSGEDKVAHIDMFDDYVQLWDGKGNHMGDFDWFYLAASIQRMWTVVALEMANRPAGMEPGDAEGGGGCGSQDTAPQEAGMEEGTLAEPDSHTTDGLEEAKRVLAKEQKMLDDFLEASAEDGRVLESQMFKRLAIIVEALTAMVRSMEEAGARKDGPEEREQPPLPPLRNNDQRREWLKSYKDWGLWYRDDNIGVDYYRYDFGNSAWLVVEAYQEEATRYYGAHETSYLHLIGGPEPPKDQHGCGRWQRHGRYTRYPNSETELVEFLKELQKKG